MFEEMLFHAVIVTVVYEKNLYLKNILNEIKCACIINVLIVFFFTNEHDLFTTIEDSKHFRSAIFGLKFCFDFYQSQHQEILMKQS